MNGWGLMGSPCDVGPPYQIQTHRYKRFHILIRDGHYVDFTRFVR